MTVDKDAEIANLQREKEELTKKLKILEKREEFRYLEPQGHLVNCPLCCFPYSKVSRLPLVGNCGHTVCGRCFSMFKDRRCPLCRIVDSFCRPAKNFLAYELLEQSNLIEEINIDVNSTILIMGGVADTRTAIFGYGYTGLILSEDRSKWIEIYLKLPYQVYASGVAFLNEEIYLFGGKMNPKSLYKLDRNLQWVRLADMNIGRVWITNSSLIWDGCIWVFGGMDNNDRNLKSVEKYDPRTDRWTLMPEMKYPRAHAAAVLYNDRIIVSGGITVDGVTNTVERYKDNRWTDLLPMPSPLMAHSVVLYQEKMLGISCNRGGHRNAWQETAQENGGDWKMDQIPTDSCAGLILDKEVYAIAGWNKQESEVLNCISIFNGEDWRRGPPFPYSIRGKSALVIPKQLADRLRNYHP